MSWIIKRDPFSDLRSLQQDCNRAFNTAFPVFFNNLGSFEESSVTGKWTPHVDIYEDKNEIALEADLPGVKPEDFKLAIENFKLTLSGERKFEHEDDQNNWHRVERGYGAFTWLGGRTSLQPMGSNAFGLSGISSTTILLSMDGSPSDMS